MDDLIALGRHGAASALVTRDGEIVDKAKNILLLFRPAWAGHDTLMRPDVRVFDLAELWAFVRPGVAKPPTVFGMTGLEASDSAESAVRLYDLMDELLAEVGSTPDLIQPWMNALYVPENSGWSWPWLDLLPQRNEAIPPIDLIELVKELPKWTKPGPPAVHEPTLDLTLREHQDRYHAGIKAFLNDPGPPQTFVAVGGTGVGKTRAYLAATLATQKPVWISTFTKALQSQVQMEAARHLGIAAQMRKGRDNYMCLRLMVEHWSRAMAGADMRARLFAVIMARWALVTPDGDMTGTGFPGWLSTLFGPLAVANMTDRLRECIYQACPFYAQCFPEGAKARSADAPLVIANHAVVASQALRPGLGGLPDILVMDEAHHVEGVMDDSLTSGISLAAAVDLRRFLLGVESVGRRRGRRAFLDTLAETIPELDRTLLNAARTQVQSTLPDVGAVDRWRANTPATALESWLQEIYQKVQENLPQDDMRTGYDWDLSRDSVPPPPPELSIALSALLANLQSVLGRMEIIDREASLGLDVSVHDPKRDVLETQAILPIRGWITQLNQLEGPLPESFIEWASVRREEGHMRDIGLFRAWLDPLRAWQAVATAAPERKIVYATATPGPALLRLPDSLKLQVDSPFDYATQARVYVITDIDNNRDAAVAAAIAPLFAASGGGALGVFTAIARLKRVHHHLVPLCEANNLRLLAQHVDEMDVATLIDLMRTEPRCTLLGTDAVRDGVDMPGEALRLLVFDRVPWPRPTLSHRARRDAYGGRTYDEDLTRLKLRQAFGRLIRTPTDRGAFVMLDSRLPSRLHDAFPEGVVIERVSLAEAIQKLEGFFENPVGEVGGRTGTLG